MAKILVRKRTDVSLKIFGFFSVLFWPLQRATGSFEVLSCVLCVCMEFFSFSSSVSLVSRSLLLVAVYYCYVRFHLDRLLCQCACALHPAHTAVYVYCIYIILAFTSSPSSAAAATSHSMPCACACVWLNSVCFNLKWPEVCIACLLHRIACSPSYLHLLFCFLFCSSVFARCTRVRCALCVHIHRHVNAYKYNVVMCFNAIVLNLISRQVCCLFELAKKFDRARARERDWTKKNWKKLKVKWKRRIME